MLAVPIIVLYEISIVLARMVEKGRPKDEYDDLDDDFGEADGDGDDDKPA